MSGRRGSEGPVPGDANAVPLWFQVIIGLGGAGLLTRILAVMIQTRDTVRDHLRSVGTSEPPTGLFKRVERLEAQLQWDGTERRRNPDRRASMSQISGDDRGH